jgi:hypothetical protein
VKHAFNKNSCIPLYVVGHSFFSARCLHAAAVRAVAEPQVQAMPDADLRAAMCQQTRVCSGQAWYTAVCNQLRGCHHVALACLARSNRAPRCSQTELRCNIKSLQINSVKSLHVSPSARTSPTCWATGYEEACISVCLCVTKDLRATKHGLLHASRGSTSSSLGGGASFRTRRRAGPR